MLGGILLVIPGFITDIAGRSCCSFRRFGGGPARRLAAPPGAAPQDPTVIDLEPERMAPGAGPGQETAPQAQIQTDTEVDAKTDADS